MTHLQGERPLEQPQVSPADLFASSDEALAAAVVRGCEPAFVELFHRYRGRIDLLVRWYCRADDAAAEELTQEVFVELFHSLPRFAARSRFYTWFYALARNVCRRQRWRARRLRAVEVATEELDPAAWRRLPTLPPEAVERLAAGELRQEVRRKVAALPEIYRTILVLRNWEEMSYAEIGSLLEIPVGTVRSRLHEARARLAAAFAEDAEENPYAL
ncbi:MAG TPA: RNA polymerase sigma factor [Thermoanaerobaculia bacterium]